MRENSHAGPIGVSDHSLALPSRLASNFAKGPRLRITHPALARAEHIVILFQDFAAGGTERIMIRLANQWAQRRRVTILCGTMAGPTHQSVGPDVEVIEAFPPIPRSPLSRLHLGRAFSLMLPALNADVLVSPGNHILPALAAMPRTAVPIVCKLSNPLESGMPRWFGRMLLSPGRRWMASRLTSIVAMSDNLKRELAAHVAEAIISVIAEPIVDDQPPAVSLRPGPRRRLVFVGRLVPQKNVALAIRALSLLPQDFTLRIVGDGPERPMLERLVRTSNLSDRVRFVGQVDDVQPHLQAGDLLVLPSRYEGYPAVAVEALAAGLAIVATDCSAALSEIITHSSMGCVASGRPRQFAAAIRQMADKGAPDPRGLEALVRRHRLSASADAWLVELDRAVRKAAADGVEVSI